MSSKWQKLAPERPAEYTCKQCGNEFQSNAEYAGIGRMPAYCSGACRQRAYRERKRLAAHPGQAVQMDAIHRHKQNEEWINRNKSRMFSAMV